MTVAEAMNELERLGFSFRLDENGEVKFRTAGNRTPEASALLDIARADRAAAAAYVRQREGGCVYSVLDALAIAQAVQHGAAVLLGPVIFHREPVTVTVLWEPVRGADSNGLEQRRNRLEKALRSRLQEMETQPIDCMTEAEMDQLCEKYDRYKAILEVCR